MRYTRDISVGDIVEFWNVTQVLSHEQWEVWHERHNYPDMTFPPLEKLATYFIVRDLKKIKHEYWQVQHPFFGYDAIIMKSTFPSEPENSKFKLWVPQGLVLPESHGRTFLWKVIPKETS